VVPNAVSAAYRQLPYADSGFWVERRFAIPAPYILTVGDLQSRKNQAGLIRGFAEMVRAYPRLKHHLVLAGKESWHAGEVRRAARSSGVADRIHFTGFVSDPELLQLYNACEFFVFPSFYEGFGLPVLEAMACGRAVIASAAGGAAEIIEDGIDALTHRPGDASALARLIAQLAGDAALRQRLGHAAALASARRFARPRLAADLAPIYCAVVERS